MHTARSYSLVVVGADSRRGMDWLRRRFPEGAWRGRALVLLWPIGELDAVLRAEPIRAEARAHGAKLSFGVAEVGEGGLDEALRAAARAYRRAFEVGGDLTVTRGTLIRAA